MAFLDFDNSGCERKPSADQLEDKVEWRRWRPCRWKWCWACRVVQELYAARLKTARLYTTCPELGRRGYHKIVPFFSLGRPCSGLIKSKPFIGNVSVSVAFSEVSIYVSPSAELSNYTPPPFPRRNTSIPNPQVGDTKTMLPFSNMRVRCLISLNCALKCWLNS